MPTATATQVLFYSSARNLRLVRRPLIMEMSSLGTQRRVQEPKRYLFAPDGNLTVREGDDVLDDGPYGEPQDVLAWLRAHPLYNVYFWEDGNEPDRLRPLERDVLGAINEATARRDTNRLQELLDAEQSTHNRRMLVDACEGALVAVRAAAGPFDDFARPEMEALATERDIPFDEEVTDDQLRAALLLSEPPPGG